MSGAQCLPVLMYHYVSRFKSPIAVSPEHFEEHCRGMAAFGWRGIGLDEAEAFLLDGTPLPPRSVLISFDDGFLDNYVYAWPLLRKYGHKAVIFTVTERLERSGDVRPTLSDVRNDASIVLPPVDTPLQRHRLGFEERRDWFLSWEEARRMEQSGVIAVAAHSAHHLAVFAESGWGPDGAYVSDTAARLPNEVCFHVPGSRLTTFYRIDAPVAWGLPRFKERPALYSRAFIPSPELTAAVSELVPQTKAEALAFFQIPEQVARLRTLVSRFEPDGLGTFETEVATRNRVRKELERCCHTLQRELGHPVRSFCWPWGSGSPLAQEEARKLGFSVFYTTQMGANPPGFPLAVKRFKVRDKGWPWLRLRLALYAHPLTARLYAACRL